MLQLHASCFLRLSSLGGCVAMLFLPMVYLDVNYEAYGILLPGSFDISTCRE